MCVLKKRERKRKKKICIDQRIFDLRPIAVTSECGSPKQIQVCTTASFRLFFHASRSYYARNTLPVGWLLMPGRTFHAEDFRLHTDEHTHLAQDGYQMGRRIGSMDHIEAL